MSPEEALAVGNAHLAQELEVLARFDAFCDDLAVHRVHDVDQALEGSLLAWIGGGTAHDLLVDLDQVGLEQDQRLDADERPLAPVPNVKVRGTWSL